MGLRVDASPRRSPQATAQRGGVGRRLVDVRDGEFVSIIGRAVRQVDLFQIIGGLLASDAGRVEIDGASPNGTRHAIGMVFPGGVDLPLAHRARQRSPSRSNWRACPSRADRGGRAISSGWSGSTASSSAYPDELSGGMRSARRWPDSGVRAAHRADGRAVRRARRADPHPAGRQVLQIWRTLQQTTLLITHNITKRCSSVIASRS